MDFAKLQRDIAVRICDAICSPVKYVPEQTLYKKIPLENCRGRHKNQVPPTQKKSRHRTTASALPAFARGGVMTWLESRSPLGGWKCAELGGVAGMSVVVEDVGDLVGGVSVGGGGGGHGGG